MTSSPRQGLIDLGTSHSPRQGLIDLTAEAHSPRQGVVLVWGQAFYDAFVDPANA